MVWVTLVLAKRSVLIESFQNDICIFLESNKTSYNVCESIFKNKIQACLIKIVYFWKELWTLPVNLSFLLKCWVTKFWKFSFIHFGQSFKSNYKWAIRGLFFFNLQTNLYRLQLITLSEKFFGLNMAATRPQSNQISTVTYFYVHNRCMDFLLLF